MSTFTSRSGYFVGDLTAMLRTTSVACGYTLSEDEDFLYLRHYLYIPGDTISRLVRVWSSHSSSTTIAAVEEAIDADLAEYERKRGN